MKRLLAALLVMALPAWSAAPTGCATLCGSWQLDTALSAAVEPVVDAALAVYRCLKAALRLATKAAIPSFWSSVANIEWKTCRS